MNLCDYGCGREAVYQFKRSKKWGCDSSPNRCPAVRKRIGNGNKGKTRSQESREKNRIAHLGKEPWNKGKTYSMSKDGKIGIQKVHSLTISKIRKRYPLFFKIEHIRYNPSNTREIQVHCKYDKCKNSKENGGWFTPTYIQLYERIRQVEKDYGNGGSYFYCSKECKDNCSLYAVRTDIIDGKAIPVYTSEEYRLWQKTILKKDNYECQKCGSKENLHCHHIIPVKIEPMFALDPDNGIILCSICHYNIGHKTGTECSLGSLAHRCKG